MHKSKTTNKKLMRPIDKKRENDRKINYILREVLDEGIEKYNNQDKDRIYELAATAIKTLGLKNRDTEEIGYMFAKMALQVEKLQVIEADLREKLITIRKHKKDNEQLEANTNKGGNKENSALRNLVQHKALEFEKKKSKFPSIGWLSKEASKHLEQLLTKDISKLSTADEKELFRYAQRRHKKLKDGENFLPPSTANKYLAELKKMHQPVGE